MKSAYDVLLERGFIAQATHEEEIKDLLSKEKISFYIGFDATANSLTAGHFLTIMAMAHMQHAGHRPIALIGGGTTRIGDPSGKSDMRQMLTSEQIDANAANFKVQLSNLIDFSDGKAIMVDNADWLLKLNYVDFIREIGVHFSVNRMLTAECYKSRLEKGLSFLEFNYMLLQSYDFLELNQRYDCVMQMGGNDQWSNILGGVELIRRKEQKPAFGLTFNLLTTSEGIKMGKTEKGALWLDKERTSPYEFFQYWRNIEDVKVKECLALLTFLPMEEVNRLGALEGAEINQAKEVLAYEITALIHGEEEAKKALEATKALFGSGAKLDNVPQTQMDMAVFETGMNLLELLLEAKLIPSKSEGRRNVQQGGVRINDVQITDVDYLITKDDFNADGELMIRKGKKVHHMIKI
ncbi:tyrosyl-tRNA synthetase [Petrocella atlantisensis]|uniref:Tyrosine--tRNA ligase n=1 Tax=Petrocella atlantisensis TaxID=2173034 RepID=A0A3P7P6Q2_9FIRM|nr:tyrosine--tRNA ligase [Petrocella atlantisensis]VDN46023.1 tyrosyl-tRNA synthetase [Petrocella atlantisensis]